MRRILFVRLGRLGDIIFTLPAVSAVKAALPEATLSFLIYPEYAALLKGFPSIDSVIELDRARYRRWNFMAVVAETLRLLRQLRRNQFDLVIDFQGFGETGLLSWCTRAPQRWGSVNRPGRAWSYTHPVPRDPAVHPVRAHLDLVRCAGKITANPLYEGFRVPEAAQQDARSQFREWNLSDSRSTLFIQPFSSGVQKNWPLNDYLSVAAHWRAQGLQVVFGGGPGEKEALEPARQAGFTIAAGAPLLVSAGLVGLSTVILGGDTGLIHLAAAMGKRVVMLMSSTIPGACFPFDHPDWAVVPESGWNVSSIKPTVVIEAIGRALAETGARLPLGSGTG